MVQTQVNSLFMNVQDDTLLLPNSSIAEVIGVRELQSVSQAPVWMLGLFEWRNREIPLVSFENIYKGTPVDANRKGQRVTVLKAIGQDPEFDFFGLLVQGMPQMIRITDQNIKRGDARNAPESSMVRVHADIMGRHAIIPDLESLERVIKRVLYH